MTTKLYNANFKIDSELWIKFKEQAKKDNSDASKLLRNFIINYLKYKENLRNN